MKRLQDHVHKLSSSRIPLHLKQLITPKTTDEDNSSYNQSEKLENKKGGHEGFRSWTTVVALFICNSILV